MPVDPRLPDQFAASTREHTLACSCFFPRFYFPQPINSSHEFFLSELDMKDGFVHMSTKQQVPGVLKRFFADVPSVAILRIDYGRLSAFKRVSWDQTSSGEGELFIREKPQLTRQRSRTSTRCWRARTLTRSRRLSAVRTGTRLSRASRAGFSK